MTLPATIDSLEAQKTYCCPGEAGSISHAIHESRLANGWPACRACFWNPVAEKTAPQLQATEQSVTGRYVNELNRRTAQILTSAFCDALAQDLDERLTVVVGFDEVHGGPDLAIGVADTALRSGCNVIDVGYATAASLDYAIRHTAAHGGFLIHSAAKNGHLQFSVQSQNGNTIQPQWQHFGIECRPVPEASEPTNALSISPDAAILRSRRNSGQLSTTELSTTFVKHLKRFWQPNLQHRVTLRIHSSIGQRYFANLVAQQNIDVIENPELQIDILSDDRQLVVQRAGQRLTQQQIADAINHSNSVAQHLTAHTINNGRSIALVDITNQTNQQHAIINNGYAIAGLLLQQSFS